MQPTSPTYWELIAQLRRSPGLPADTRAARLIRFGLLLLALTPLLTLLP